MPARFKMNNKGVGRLLRSPQMQAEMLRRADVIRSLAEALSPVGGAGDPHPGLYKASWETTSTRRGGSLKNRATATVYNTTDYGGVVEFGSSRVPAHHVLLRAAAVGGR